MIKYLVIAAAAGMLASCTTAGPYVTNISSDGNWGLNVEKCKVHMNAFLGIISTGDCSNQNIKLQNGAATSTTTK